MSGTSVRSRDRSAERLRVWVLLVAALSVVGGVAHGQTTPPADGDSDGIPDMEDLCPAAAETRNGAADEDGCPDADGDGDRVPDDYDTCPGVPETANGFEDGDGCPDADRF